MKLFRTIMVVLTVLCLLFWIVDIVYSVIQSKRILTSFPLDAIIMSKLFFTGLCLLALTVVYFVVTHVFA